MKTSDGINKTIILNLFSAFFAQGVSFLTIPVFTRLLGADQYGLYSVFASWSSIFACILGLGVSSSISVGIYRFRDRYYNYRSSILLLSLVINMLIIGICIVFRNYIYRWFGYDQIKLTMLVMAALGQFMIGFVQTVFVYEKKPVANFIVSMVLVISGVLISIFLIVKFPGEIKYYGRITGMGLPCFLAGIVICLFFYFKCPGGISYEYTKFGLSVGLPVVFHNLANNILTQSDRVMMEQAGISDSDIGVYSFYYTLSSVLTVILNAFNSSWCPYYYDDLSNHNYTVIKKKSRNYLELFSVFAILFLLLFKEVSHIFAPKDYWYGEAVTPYLVLTAFFTLLYQFPVNFEFYHRKTKMVAFGTVAAALLNIALNTLFIPSMGMRGAAIATCASYFGLFSFHLFIVKKIMTEYYHMSLSEFIPWILLIVMGILISWLGSDLYMFRWCFAIVICACEFTRVYKRKSIF